MDIIWYNKIWSFMDMFIFQCDADKFDIFNDISFSKVFPRFVLAIHIFILI